jgi:alkanesulfonate monooxygenase SsuD/methylene tetrahydromethanopterin reductase-like flavin-dependent oxidoreductase (luciferase family)
VSLTFGLVLDFLSPTVTLEEQLRRYRPIVEAADRYGFDSVTMGEAYSSAPQWGHTPGLFLVLAALAPTTRMRLGSGVTLLPAWHPLKLAYDTAVLDQLSGGRLIVGVGLGGPELVHRFGYRQARKGGYIDEVLAALRALWAGANGYQGTHLSIARGIAPLPLQPGGPPIWVGGSVQRSVDRAAAYGDGYLGYLGSTSQAFDQVVELGERYRAALAARGKDPRGAVVASNRLTLVAESEGEARALGEAYCGEVLRFYANRGAQMPPEFVGAGKTPAELFHALDETRCLVGTPERVAERARRYEQAGVTHIMARITPHGIPAEHAVRTVELLGEHVLPQFR